MATDFHRGHARSRHAPSHGWHAFLWRVIRAFLNDDDLWSVSAGVAFYAWFATVFSIVFLVSLYGLEADPGTVRARIEGLSGVMPEGAVGFLADQMQSVANTTRVSLETRLGGALLVALWSARAAVASLIAALNITHNEPEERGFLRLQSVTLALTVGSAVFGTVALALVVIVPSAIGTWPISPAMKTTVSLLRWPVLAVLTCIGLGLLYRFAPCRRTPQWRWVSSGAVTATILCILGSAAFSRYVESVSANHDAFGAHSAALVMQTWFYITALAILLGAKLNAEAEHQTEAAAG